MYAPLGGAVEKTFMIPYNAFHFKTLCTAIKSFETYVAYI